MDNKLSELSKPVAWVTMQPEFCDDERTVITNHIEAEKYNLECYDLTQLYSQEYVSALLARIANLEFEQGGYGYSVLEDLNGKIKRIAELEEQLATWASRAEALGAKLDAAEKRLATPVRLPDSRQCVSGDRYQWSDGVHNYRQDTISTLREQGFTVGDE